MGGNTIWYSLHKKHSLRLSLTIESTFVSNVFNEALKAILQKVTKCIFFPFHKPNLMLSSSCACPHSISRPFYFS